MKAIPRCSLPQRLLFYLLLVGLASPSFAQITNPFNATVVNILATDPTASESGDTGEFTLFRDGPATNSLTVFWRLGGTASNGVDYVFISNRVTFPVGANSATVTVTPIADDLLEGP